MNDQKNKKWETTNVTNLLRHQPSRNYYSRVKVGGKDKWRSLKTEVFTVAKLRLADVLKEERAKAANGGAGHHGATGMGHFITLYLDRINSDPSLQPQTKERKANSVKALERTWPGLGLCDARRITPGACRDWGSRAVSVGTTPVAPNARTTKTGMSASNFNKALDALRGILGIAVEDGVLYANPADAVKKAKKRRRILLLPSTAQFSAIVCSVASQGGGRSKHCAHMVRLLAYSGTRLREATALRWHHVDFEKGTLLVAGTKTESSQRTVPLFTPLRTLLLEMKPADDPHLAQKILSVGSCKDSLGRACTALGIPPMRHHDLRHLFATRCIESGVDVPTVSRWLGHSDGGVLAMATYGHLRQEHSLAAAEKVRF